MHKKRRLRIVTSGFRYRRHPDRALSPGSVAEAEWPQEWRFTCRAAPANPSTFAALTTPGRLRSLRSASSLSFLVILLPQNNSLTFVRGADRAYCAPRKWSWRPTTAHLYQQPHAPRRGIGVRTRRRHLAARATPKGVERAPGSGTLPPFAALTALIVRRERM